jgi:hypothetical protein
MNKLCLFIIILLVCSCGPKSATSPGVVNGPARACPVAPDVRSPGRIARSALEMRQSCGLNEDEVLSRYQD